MRGDSGNYEEISKALRSFDGAGVRDLFKPFSSKLVRLLALDSQSRDWKYQVALFESLCPLQSGVDDGCINTGNLCQDRRDMGSIDIDWVGFWVAIGVFG